MKLIVQRVEEASVAIDGEIAGEIGRGYLVLLGVTHTDTRDIAERLSRKLLSMRIFTDEAGKINRSLVDIGGSVLVVSQFTLYADTAHGNRPGFSDAARPELAEPLYEHFVAQLRTALGDGRVATGRFGAHMKVRLLNDGPFTVELSL